MRAGPDHLRSGRHPPLALLPVGATRKRCRLCAKRGASCEGSRHGAELWLSSCAALTGLDRADGDETSRRVLDIGERHSTYFRGLAPKNMGEQLAFFARQLTIGHLNRTSVGNGVAQHRARRDSVVGGVLG